MVGERRCTCESERFSFRRKEAFSSGFLVFKILHIVQSKFLFNNVDGYSVIKFKAPS